MSDFYEDEPTPEELEQLSALLSNDAVWAEASPEVEDNILAAIQAEAGSATAATIPPERPQHRSVSNQPEQRVDNVTSIVDAPSRRSRPFGAAVMGAVAASILLIGGFFATQTLTQPSFEVVAMAGTPDAADASGVAKLDRTDDGLRILLDVTNLPPAPEGSYYQAWLVRPSPKSRISAGTFHLRGGGDTQIELWSGVSPSTYPTLSVTLQEESDPLAPGTVVLLGEILGE